MTRHRASVERLRGRQLQERRALYFQLYPLCVHCHEQGKLKPARELDHKVPLFKGGADAPHNWQGLCKACHKAKTQRDLGNRPARRIGVDGFPVEEGVV